MEYYDLLEINKDASLDEIKKAYRRLTLKYHPDRNLEKSNCENFIKIQKAYQILSDPNQKKYYDLTGKTFENNLSGLPNSNNFSGLPNSNRKKISSYFAPKEKLINKEFIVP